MKKLTDEAWVQVLREVDFQFSRSSGPGGQKVNKTESKAELRWHLESSMALTGTQKKRARLKLVNQLNSEGFVVLQSDQQRSREQNKKACADNLKAALNRALHIPKPRRKTKPTKSSVRKRLDSKKRQGDRKKGRQKVDY